VEEERAARQPSNEANQNPMGAMFDVGNPTGEKRKTAEEIAREQLEARAKTLKSGGVISFESRTVTSTTTALQTTASNTINPTFEQVGTLDKVVNETVLNGGESYKKPFVKTIGEGGVTAEGADYTTAEPTFDYAPINKIKITAYAEVNEEVKKLPAANYLAEVEKAVIGAYRKKLITQIVKGNGTNEMVGIVNTPTSIMPAANILTIAAIDENTLDNIIFKYGGDEDVEGSAYLILNKLTLAEFAKIKGADKRRAYDIVLRGNTGTINGIPFVLTSRFAPFATVTTGNYYIAYGNPKNYELTQFSPIEVAMSTDYKFKQGQIAYRVSGFVGGSVAAYNGFLLVKKATA
jgi:HK97 family phage major capsid protein